MTTKSFVLPLEKIRETTPYGNLETGTIPKNAYDSEENNLKPGRVLILKSKKEFQIISYIPPHWQITLTTDGAIRAHGLIPSTEAATISAHEGHLQNASAIDPWEHPDETLPYMPWAKNSFTINLENGATIGEPLPPFEQSPLTSTTFHPLLIWPQKHSSYRETLSHLKNEGFNPNTDILTTSQINGEIKIRSVDLRKAWRVIPQPKSP